MNDIRVGTLVLLKAPDSILNAPLHSGMIGTVKDSSKFNAEIPVGNVAVEFPTVKSAGYTGWWKVAVAYLVPLGGNDVLDEDEKADNPYFVEEVV